MNKMSFLLIALILTAASCGGSSDNNNDNGTGDSSEYKQRMREFVIGISQYAKGIDSDFIIIPQNGQELVTADGDETGDPATEYLSAIDGVGREDLFYGYDEDNAATPSSASEYMIAFLDICEANGVEVLVTDYCSDHDKMDDSYERNEEKGYISFAAPVRELNKIPDYPADPYNVNDDDIDSLADAQNFLYIINPDQFSSKTGFISSVSDTNYDVILMDLFFDNDNDEQFTQSEITSLKSKKDGGTRLIISYMSIGEAEDYRYYWEDSWEIGSPSWIVEENPDWEGNYIVQYWDSEWQDIIFGNDDSYLKKIIDAGFDGVYLDIIDAFEYFE